mmetsp:Transcript_35479/g.36148  ORF Transcript_35479/g.36148 Transcript_35479/m.36148 type:complete len:88 (+) Transcript_35479:95-358(+)
MRDDNQLLDHLRITREGRGLESTQSHCPLPPPPPPPPPPPLVAEDWRCLSSNWAPRRMDESWIGALKQEQNNLENCSLRVAGGDAPP